MVCHVTSFLDQQDLPTIPPATGKLIALTETVDCEMAPNPDHNTPTQDAALTKPSNLSIFETFPKPHRSDVVATIN